MGFSRGTVGRPKMAGKRPSTLSGKERQRVYIARALAQQPRLLMLKEPMNHFYIHHRRSLFWLAGRLPLTVVMALHELNHTSGCDRLAVTEAGRVVACATPANMLSLERIADNFSGLTKQLFSPRKNVTQLRIRAQDDRP